jgi:hypothetical protein
VGPAVKSFPMTNWSCSSLNLESVAPKSKPKVNASNCNCPLRTQHRGIGDIAVFIDFGRISPFDLLGVREAQNTRSRNQPAQAMDLMDLNDLVVVIDRDVWIDQHKQRLEDKSKRPGETRIVSEAPAAKTAKIFVSYDPMTMMPTR